MKRGMAMVLAAAAVMLVGLRADAAEPKKEAPKPAEPGVSLTVYNSNLGVVKERRVIDFRPGTSEVRFDEVARQIDATSVHFKSLDAPDDVTILEQNYEYDLVNANKLLEKFLDKEVTVLLKDGNRYTGTLMSFDGEQIVLKGKAGALTMLARSDNVKDIQFPNLPEGLIVKPTLMWKVAAKAGGRQLAEVTYMTSGINWEADYTAVANEDDTKIDLGGWVTINNQSGAAYKDAKLKLIAGDIHRAERPTPMMADRMGARAMKEMAPGFEEKTFFEYHLYTLPRPATVKENQVKQIELLNAADVPVDKLYVYDFYRKQKKVMVNLEFVNSEKNNAGMPLPMGRVRVFKRDSDGSLELLGEDNIDHTPKDEQVRLYVGDAFDLTPEFKQVDYKKTGEKVDERTILVKLRNHKDSDVEINVVEHPGGWTSWVPQRMAAAGVWANWEVKDNSHPFVKKDSDTIEFKVKVKKGEEVELRYTIRRWW